MSFTFEPENRNHLESYEWDNTWLEQSRRSDLPRVLYIGDSISCGIRRQITERSEGRCLVDGFGSSKAIDHPALCECIRLFAAQETRRDVILLNSGLHGWHLEDGEEYARHYDAAVAFLKKTYPKTPLYLVLTTAAVDDHCHERVKVRNAGVRAIAERHALPLIDLYTASCEHRDLQKPLPDGVHFETEGYALFADLILSVLERDGIIAKK